MDSPLPWRALAGYFGLALLGLLLAIRLPGSGPALGVSAVPAAASTSGLAPLVAGRAPRLAVGDILAWLATGSADGPVALLRSVLPGFGLAAAAPQVPAAAPQPAPPSPPDNLAQTVHHPLATDAPGAGPVMVLGVHPLVLVYETDPAAGVVASELARDLFSGYGIAVVHLTAPFTGVDPYPAAQAAVQALMARWPTLRVLLDVHADQPAGEPLTAQIEGAPTARLMIVVGDSQTLPEPNWRQNAAWAIQVGAAAQRAHPGLLRPYQGRAFYADGGRFNQQLSPAALLLAIGGRGVPADAELRGADRAAQVLGPMLEAGQYPR